MNPTDLTEARIILRIRSANPSIGKETAREMAVELRGLIECALKLWAAELDFLDFPAVDEAMVSPAMLRAIIEDHGHETDGEYLADMLSGPDGSSDLYLGYMRLFEHQRRG